MSFRFNLLAKNTDLPKDKLDSILIELDAQRYISEFVMPKSDVFIIKLSQKGYDAMHIN